MPIDKSLGAVYKPARIDNGVLSASCTNFSADSAPLEILKA